MPTRAISQTAVDCARELYLAGRFDDAFSAAETLCESLEPFEKLSGLLLKACIQSERDLYAECLQTLKLAGPLIDEAPAKLEAAFYGQRAYARVKLGKRDKAMVDYEAARFWAQEAGDELAEATVRNNLAKIYGQVGRHEEAIAESESAISIARKLGERIHLGRFYDQRAQILIDRKEYREALSWSQKALGILESHPSSAEARVTYGRAMIALGESYLDHPDRVENFRTRHGLGQVFSVVVDDDIIQLALTRAGGNVQHASFLLGLPHQSLQRSMNRRELRNLQSRKVRRSIITK